MARITCGPAVADIRGKVGGAIFQRSSYGLSLKGYTRPVNTHSIVQSSRRAALSDIQTAWQSLTPAQRTSWDHWATYMNMTALHAPESSLFGQHAFIRVNTYRRLSGASFLTDPVFTPLALVPYTLEVQNTGPELLLIMPELVSAGNYHPHVSLSWQLAPGRNTRPKVVRHMLPTSQTIEGSWTIGIPYTEAYGYLVGSETIIWAEHLMQQTDNGALTQFLSHTIAVTEL